MVDAATKTPSGPAITGKARVDADFKRTIGIFGQSRANRDSGTSAVRMFQCCRANQFARRPILDLRRKYSRDMDHRPYMFGHRPPKRTRHRIGRYSRPLH